MHDELTQSEVEYEYDMFALRYKPAGFSATPGGLSINSATGIIDVSASASGTYVELPPHGQSPQVVKSTLLLIQLQL